MGTIELFTDISRSCESGVEHFGSSTNLSRIVSEAADNGSKLVNDGLACCELFLQHLLRKQLCSDTNSVNFIRNLNEVELGCTECANGDILSPGHVWKWVPQYPQIKYY